LARAGAAIWITQPNHAPAAGWEEAISCQVRVGRRADLLEIVLALSPPHRFTDRVDRRHKQGHQHAENGDDDEQLNQGKGRIFLTRDPHGSMPPLPRPAAAQRRPRLKTSVPTIKL